MALVWNLLKTASSARLFLGSRCARLVMRENRFLSTSRRLMSAKNDLLQCLDSEIKTETVPSISNFGDFETKLSGCIATLSKIARDGSMMQIRMDANNSTETIVPVTEEVEGSTEETIQPMFMPLFTVDIQKHKGAVLRMECTFEIEEENEGPKEEMDVGDAFIIQSVSLIPPRATAEQVYSVDASSLSEELYDSLEAYTKEQGLTSDVLADMLEFYSKFEHNCYVKGFLHEVKHFLRN